MELLLLIVVCDAFFKNCVLLIDVNLMNLGQLLTQFQSTLQIRKTTKIVFLWMKDIDELFGFMFKDVMFVLLSLFHHGFDFFGFVNNIFKQRQISQFVMNFLWSLDVDCEEITIVSVPVRFHDELWI